MLSQALCLLVYFGSIPLLLLLLIPNPFSNFYLYPHLNFFKRHCYVTGVLRSQMQARRFVEAKTQPFIGWTGMKRENDEWREQVLKTEGQQARP